MPFVEQPTVLALLIADAAYADSFSGKLTILGCFSELNVPEIPAIVPGFVVYAVLTNGLGIGELTVRIVDVDEEHELQVLSHEIELKDPRQTFQWLAQFDNQEFSKAGEYRIQFLADGEMLLERRLLVRNLGDRHDD